jgi:hypothetical protein
LLEGKGGVHALIICHSGTVQRWLTLFPYSVWLCRCCLTQNCFHKWLYVFAWFCFFLCRICRTYLASRHCDLLFVLRIYYFHANKKLVFYCAINLLWTMTRMLNYWVWPRRQHNAAVIWILTTMYKWQVAYAYSIYQSMVCLHAYKWQVAYVKKRQSRAHCFCLRRVRGRVRLYRLHAFYCMKYL